MSGLRWIAEPTNREPDKCAAVRWFALDDLPGDIIDYPAAGIHAYRNGIQFSTEGWTSTAHGGSNIDLKKG